MDHNTNNTNNIDKSNNQQDIVFFSAVDRNPATGEVRSEYPAWFHDRQIEELQASIHSQEQFLKNNRIGGEHVQKAISELERSKEKLSGVESAMPKLNAKQKDSIAKGVESIKSLIKEALPTYEQMKRNTVDAHEEAKRMSQPCINIKRNAELAKLAEVCNIPIDRKGNITRDHATKMAHIMSKSLGERFFVESLRR